MSEKKTGGPAFPVECLWNGNPEPLQGIQTGNGQGWAMGMTLRDYFAAKALEGWIASYAGSNSDPIPDRCAILAYSLADAMLAERAK